jgi:hypothetical protein
MRRRYAASARKQAEARRKPARTQAQENSIGLPEMSVPATAWAMALSSSLIPPLTWGVIRSWPLNDSQAARLKL